MLIQCTIEREGGSLITIDGVEYHFKENDKGHHVCDVDTDEHAQRFIGISSAYKAYKGGKSPVKPVIQKPPTIQVDHSAEDMVVDLGNGIYDVFKNGEQAGANVSESEVAGLVDEAGAPIVSEAGTPVSDEATPTGEPYLEHKGGAFFLLYDADGILANDGKSIRGKKVAQEMLEELKAG